MEDPVVGGYTPEKIALRRAIGMAYDANEFIRVMLKGRAMPAHEPDPAGHRGLRPGAEDHGAQLTIRPRRGRCSTGSATSDRDGDGYRETPDGKPLALERWSAPTSLARQGDELWKKNMDAIGIRIVFKKDRLPELRKMARQGKIPMRGDGWNADYPDAENFMQLLYGPNAGRKTRRGSGCPSSTSSTTRRGSCPIRRSAPAVRPDDRARARVRAVAPDRAPARGPAAPAVGPPLRAASDQGRQVWKYVDVDEGAAGNSAAAGRRRLRPAQRPRLEGGGHNRVVVVVASRGDRVDERRVRTPGERRVHTQPLGARAAMPTSLARIFAAARGA